MDVILGDGNIAIGSYDGYLYFLSPEGDLVAKYNTGEKIFASPAVLNGNVLVYATVKGSIHFLSIERL